ncbi:DUF58 domain-containing protein [Schlesneria sp.]|uniref:DUF58 domain-containing protein n=1 Tax=Schlesneria sp. TaxID=2762018 RepID=UPI002EF8E755
MTQSVLSRYLNPEILRRVADRPLEPHGLVMGNLAGAHKSPLSGFAVEFAGHRDYIVGDDPRHIDWRLYYKRDRLSIKQYEMETNFVCHLVLDISASMRYGAGNEQKLFCAAQAATTLAYSIVAQNDKVSLTTFDNRIQGYVPPGNTLAQIHRIIQHLDRISPVEKTNMVDCLTDLTGRMGRREIVMIFSDFFTDLTALETVLQRMKYNRHEIVLFHILHPHERTFQFEGMVKFLGMEETAEYLTQTEDIRNGYLASLHRYEAAFEDLCRRNAIECVSVDTSGNLGDDLVEYLNQRTRVRLR